MFKIVIIGLIHERLWRYLNAAKRSVAERREVTLPLG